MIEDILSKLEKVRRTGPNNWLACCPAHDDRSPSMTLHDDAGKVAVYCHAGCSFHEIVGAVGLGFEPWFPPGVNSFVAPRRAFPAADVLEALAFESTLVTVAALNVANGITLTAEDLERLKLANKRIQTGRDLALAR